MLARTLLLVTLGLTLTAACGSDDDDTAGTGGASGSAGKGSGGKGGGAGSGNTAGKGTGGGSTGGKGGSGTGGSSNAGEAGSGADAGAPSGGDNPLCKVGCELTLDADCPNGPPTQDQCESDCQMLSSGACAEPYADFQACAEGEEITCDANSGFPTVEACSDEQSAFIACLVGG